MPRTRHKEPGSQVGKRCHSHIELYPSVAVSAVIPFLFSPEQMVAQSIFGRVEKLPAAKSGALNPDPHTFFPLPSCAGPGDCLLRWLQMEKKVEEEKWQMVAGVGSKQETSPLCDKH